MGVSPDPSRNFRSCKRARTREGRRSGSFLFYRFWKTIAEMLTVRGKGVRIDSLKAATKQRVVQSNFHRSALL